MNIGEDGNEQTEKRKGMMSIGVRGEGEKIDHMIWVRMRKMGRLGREEREQRKRGMIGKEKDRLGRKRR